MLVTSDLTVERQFCAPVSPTLSEEPIGSASTFDQLIALELALPWSSHVWAAKHVPPGLVELCQQVEVNGLNLKALAMVPDLNYSRPGYTRVFHFSRPAGPFAIYNKSEFIVPNREIVSLVEALLEQPAKLDHFTTYRQNTSHVRELFVCTHGSRDVCCGRFGHPVYQTLRQHYGQMLADRLRVWRVSHIGGHRFAPTLIDMPEGRYWGHLEQEMLPALIGRQGSVSELRRFYRGWAALNEYEQIVEREMFSQIGWPWLSYLKTAQTAGLVENQNRVNVRIDFTTPDGAMSGAYEALMAADSQVITRISQVKNSLTQVAT